MMNGNGERKDKTLKSERKTMESRIE